MKKIVLLFFILICMFSMCFAHSGRTDKYGGHYDRSTGTYHYHNGGYATSVEEDSSIDEDEQEDGLKIVTDTSNEIKALEDRVNILQSEITSKQNTITDLNKKLAEKNKEIEEIKSEQEGWNVILGIIIVCLIVLLVKRKKSTS